MRLELLLDRLLAVEARSWLCLRARGTGGGALFCVEGVSDWPEFPEEPLGLDSRGGRASSDVGSETISAGGERIDGVGGRGLFRSESVLFRGRGEEVASVAANSENDTVCGVLDVTSFPCRCFGAGGGFFFSTFLTSVTSPTVSSSEEAISYDVRGVSTCVSETGSIDCREIEDVSVLLLLSKTVGAAAVEGVAVCGAELDGLEMPVMRSRLKPSTSRFALGAPFVGFSAAGRPDP